MEHIFWAFSVVVVCVLIAFIVKIIDIIIRGARSNDAGNNKHDIEELIACAWAFLKYDNYRFASEFAVVLNYYDISYNALVFFENISLMKLAERITKEEDLIRAIYNAGVKDGIEKQKLQDKDNTWGRLKHS